MELIQSSDIIVFRVVTAAESTIEKRGVKPVFVESRDPLRHFKVIDFDHRQIIAFRYSHIITKIIRSELPPLSMPEIKCSECGNLISLPSTAYQNVENADVNCVQCNARLIVTFQNGELKHLTKGEPTS